MAPLFFIAGALAPFALAEISHGHAGFDAVACLATRASADISALLQVVL